MDATPYAYIADDGTWHERAEGLYLEEKARSERIHTLAMEHLALHGRTNYELLRQRITEVPEPVTAWHRIWHQVTDERTSIVAFVRCHF